MHSVHYCGSTVDVSPSQIMKTPPMSGKRTIVADVSVHGRRRHKNALLWYVPSQKPPPHLVTPASCTTCPPILQALSRATDALGVRKQDADRGEDVAASADAEGLEVRCVVVSLHCKGRCIIVAKGLQVPPSGRSPWPADCASTKMQRSFPLVVMTESKFTGWRCRVARSPIPFPH